jgi:hypothetical protein
MRYNKRTVAKAKERTRVVERQGVEMSEIRKQAEEEATALARKELEHAEKQKEERDKIELLRREREETKRKADRLRHLPPPRTAERDALAVQIEEAEQEVKRQALIANKKAVDNVLGQIERDIERVNTKDKIELLKAKQKLAKIGVRELENPNFDIRQFVRPVRRGYSPDEDESGFERLRVGLNSG